MPGTERDKCLYKRDCPVSDPCDPSPMCPRVPRAQHCQGCTEGELHLHLCSGKTEGWEEGRAAGRLWEGPAL